MMNGFQRLIQRRFLVKFGFPLVAVVGALTYAYLRHGISTQALVPIGIFLGTYFYLGYITKIWKEVNHTIVYATAWGLHVSFLMWHPSEYSFDFSAVNEFPNLAALSFAGAMGFVAIVEKAWQEDNSAVYGLKDLPMLFWGLRRYLVPFSIVMVTGYGAFLFYAFAMYQIFVNGIYLYVVLAAVSIIALVASVHKVSGFK